VSTVLLCALLLIVITALVIWQVRTRGYLFVGWLWYIVTLLPVIGLVQVGNQAMADRYTYIPLIGLFIMIAWGVPELLANYNFRKPVLVVTATASVVAMSAVTYVNLGYWQNSVTILEHAIEVTQNNRFAEANLGVAYLQKNIYDQAIVHFEKVLQNDPNDAMTNLNIGVALFRKGKIDEAIVHFEKTLQNDPCDVAVRLNLGVALTRQGKIQQAIEHYNEALRIDPCCVDAINLRQKLLRQQQKQ
jgi:tetratricopeptide (TPR) repeat protein